MFRVHAGASVASAAFAVLLSVAPACAEKRVALVVGNGAYQHVGRLTNPRNDAELMAETLKSIGFTLIGDRALVDLDKTGFDNAVQNFGAQLQGAEVGLFYYAGHGVQVRGANYLVPVGANPTKEADVDFQMLDTNLVLRQMEGSGTKLNVVILDACRNNPFGGRGLRTTTNGLAQMQAPEGTLISYATQPGNVARDGTDGNSPYTKALAQTMRRAGLDIFQTFNEVGLAVKITTGGSQQPWVSSSPISGNFYFAGAPTGTSANPTSPQSPTPTNDPAERAWVVTQNTTSVAVLEDFIRQFGNTPYGSMARARLGELKKGQVAMATPGSAPGISQNQSSKYVGCFKDQGDPFGTTGRDLNGAISNDSGLTIGRCVELCRSKGFRFAGMQFASYCFCGNKYGSYGSGTCDNKCSGNPNEICGGFGSNSIYQVGNRSAQ